MAEIESAGGVLTLPMAWNLRGTLWVHFEDPERGGEEPKVGYQLVTPGYFETLQIPLVRGRRPAESDDATAPSVALVNQAMADLYWPDGEVVGSRIAFSNPEEADSWVTVIGVVGNTRMDGLDQSAPPEAYLPYTQSTLPYVTIAARGPTDSASLIAAIRTAIDETDPLQPVTQVVELDQAVRRSVGPRRFKMWLLSLFAGVAMVMAAIGLYGALSFSVSRRKKEIGIRAALGARPRRLVRQVVGEGMALVVIGLTLGAAGGIALGGFIASQVHGISASDVTSYVLGISLMAAVAVLACYIPARRAARTDPMLVLRGE